MNWPCAIHQLNRLQRSRCTRRGPLVSSKSLAQLVFCLAVTVASLTACDSNGEFDKQMERDCDRLVERAEESLDGRNLLEVVVWSCKDKSRSKRAVYLTQLASGGRRTPHLLFVRTWNDKAIADQTTLVAWSATDPAHAFIKNVEQSNQGGEWLRNDFSFKGVRFSMLGFQDEWPPSGARSEGHERA